MNLPKWLKVTFFVVLAVTYLNIGYKYSDIAKNITEKHRVDTFIENVISGGWGLFYSHRTSGYGVDDYIISLMFWPILLCLSMFFWIIFLFWQFLIFFWEGIQFFWWLIFCGGLYNLVGASGIMGILVVLAGFFSYFKLNKYWEKLPNK